MSFGNNIANNSIKGLETNLFSRSSKVGGLLLRRTKIIAAFWEEGANQAESGALNTVKASSSAPLALTPKKGC